VYAEVESEGFGYRNKTKTNDYSMAEEFTDYSIAAEYSIPPSAERQEEENDYVITSVDAN
jgi:hypothetical protein